VTAPELAKRPGTAAASVPLTFERGCSDSKDMDRSFHQFGILVASIVMAIGLTLIAGAAIFRLDLMETLADRELALALGGALVVLGIFSIASYCVVRAIEWANRR